MVIIDNITINYNQQKVRDTRKIRQREGIQLAKIKGIYKGRINVAKSSPSVILSKCQNVSDLLDKSDLSVRQIAGITGHSVNTVRKIKQLKKI